METTKTDSIYEFGSLDKFNTLKCIYSNKYAHWNGRYISDCFIPDSNINFPKIIEQILIDLNNYPMVSKNKMFIVTYSVGEDNYAGIIKMVDYDGTGNLGFQIKEISINDCFVTSNTIRGDTALNGDLNVLDFNNQSIIKTDNIS